MGKYRSDSNFSSLPDGPMKLFAYVGVCLACVQQAERALQSAIKLCWMMKM